MDHKNCMHKRRLQALKKQQRDDHPSAHENKGEKTNTQKIIGITGKRTQAKNPDMQTAQ